MRHVTVDGPGSTISEALDAASGGLLFALLVAVIGVVVGLAGWAAGTYATAGILLGCAVLSALVASAVWGILRWGIDEESPAELVSAEQPDNVPIRHAA